MGDVPKLQCFFLRETDEYSGLCEQERYRDGAPMRGLPKGSASCQALILGGVEESLCRRFGSLFGLGVEILIEKKFFGASSYDRFYQNGCDDGAQKDPRKCLPRMF